MMRYRISKSFLSACFAMIAGMTGFIHIANANTPDGSTPANEGICDNLQTATKGLYGLCVAYCEAQDLDMLDKEPPSIKILENYEKKMQPGDPQMPCIKCVTQQELNEMVADGTASCNRLITNRITITDNGNLNFAEVDKTPGRERCRFVDVDTVPATVRSHVITRDLDLTVTVAERAQMYYDAISSTCQSIGQ